MIFPLIGKNPMKCLPALFQFIFNLDIALLVAAVAVTVPCRPVFEVFAAKFWEVLLPQEAAHIIRRNPGELHGIITTLRLQTL